MEASQEVLDLVLRELGIEPAIDSVGDRKRIQKAIYLAQAIGGVDLGYRFSWYLLGPYSAPLARDYFGLAGAIEAGEPAPTRKLSVAARDRLATLVPLMSPPPTVTLNGEDWLELVASIDYLHRVSKMDQDRSAEVLKKQKPHLMHYFDRGVEALNSFGSN